MNLYGFVDNDSINYVDHLGQQPTALQTYCDAAQKYPQNQWLACACKVSYEINTLLLGLVNQALFNKTGSPKYKDAVDIANWFRCTRGCLLEKFDVALKKFEGYDLSKKEQSRLTPAWDKACKTCEGAKKSETECCNEMVVAEQTELQSCMSKCGTYHWSNPPFFPADLSFKNLEDRIKYGTKLCCDPRKKQVGK